MDIVQIQATKAVELNFLTLDGTFAGLSNAYREGWLPRS
jgi:hypothetical protein